MLQIMYRQILFVMAIILLVVGTISAQTSENVVVQLNWVHDSSFAGFYMAINEGDYAEYGLDVELNIVFDDEGNFIDVIDAVVSGQAQFGIADAATLLQARANDIPVVAIASNFQRNPLAFISLAENEILSPDDLIGKTVHVAEYNTFMLNALLAASNIDPSEVNIVERLDYSTSPLTSGDADVLDGWVTNEVAILASEGIELNAIFPFEYGIDMYPDLIFISETLLEENPELIQAFLEATFQGMQRAIDDPEYAATVSLIWDESKTIEAATELAFRLVPLLNLPGSQLGLMEATIWDLSYEILVEAEILEAGIEIENAYTLQFLDTIYGE